MITVSQSSTLNKPTFINGAEFKSSSISHQSKPVAISLHKAKSFQKQQTSPHFDIEFFDFGSKFIFEIIAIEGELPSKELALHLKFDDNVIKLTLLGDWDDNEGLYVKNFGFDVKQQGETSVSAFLLKTFWAMLGLSSMVKIKIPVLHQEATMSFDTNLNSISELLQTRQIAYRMMVIEKSFRVKLPFPDYLDGTEVENIAYCYHSVVDRKFEWFCPPAIVPWFATPEYLSLLPKKNVPFPVQFGPEPFEKEIFGCRIDLGLQLAKIEEYILDNFDEVKKKLSKLDGGEVWTQSRSKNGVMLIESVTTPYLPKNAFSPEIQKLIDLDSKLDSIILDKYFALTATGFKDITNEQKEAIFERPNLNEETFDF